MTNQVCLPSRDVHAVDGPIHHIAATSVVVQSSEAAGRIKKACTSDDVSCLLTRQTYPSQTSLASGGACVQRAHELLRQVDRNNSEDLGRLFASLGPDWGDERRTAVERMTQDQARCHKILSRLAKPDCDVRYRADLQDGYYPLITGLTKLVGAQGQPGLLCEAIAWLTASSSLDESRTGPIECHAVTVSKVALLYASGVQPEHSRRVRASQLTVCYPADVPADCEADFEPLLLAEITMSARAQRPAKLANLNFFVPNSGFVFGGDMFGSICRGLDCSAFVSYCVQSPMRLSTVHLEEIAHSLVPNGRSISGLLAQVAASLEVVPNETKTLHTGDIVVWRGDSGGHTAFFEAWANTSKKTFFAIDASRWGEGSDSRDGIATAELSLFREDKKTFILRSRPDKSAEIGALTLPANEQPMAVS